MKGTNSQNIKTGSGNISYLVIDNTNGVTATGDCRMGTAHLEIRNGILDIGTYRFWVSQLNQANVYNTLETNVANYDNTKMIRTAGNKTDGGFALSFGKNQTDANDIFPVGVGTNYMPMQLDINGTVSVSSNNQLTVIPVSGEHPAVDGSHTGEALTAYWKINNLGYWGHEFTGSTTDVNYIFYYNNTQLAAGYPGNGGGGDDGNGDLNSGTADEWIPGSFINTAWSNEATTDVDGANTNITFNGAADNGIGGVIAGEFTVGSPNALTGSYEQFYSIADGEWNNNAGGVWSYSEGGAAISTSLEPGQFNKVHIQHEITIAENNKDAYDVTLYNPNDAFLDVGTTTGHTFGVVYPDPDNNRGRFRTATPTLPTADFTPFCSKTYANFRYYGGTYTLPSSPEIYPSLNFQSDAGETKTLPDVDISINGDMKIYDGSVVTLGTAANGDLNAHRIIVQGKLLFPNSGSRTVVVDGNLTARWAGDNREIDVEDGGDGKHKLIVTRDISLNDGTFDFFGNGGSTVDLYMTDSLSTSVDDAVFDNQDYEGGNTDHKANIILNRLIINKGNDQTTVVNINTDFALMGANNGDTKALELRSGTLILDDLTTADGADTDIDLSTGGANFSIPAEAGLKVNLGSVNITGDDVGMELDGKFWVNGGTATIASSTSSNNFIEYSGSGNAEIEVSAGTLTVGSQIRRQTMSTDGVLKYTQSGGNVVVGKYDAPEDNRGIFEVLNAGSEFNFTGGTFEIANAQDNPTVASLYLDPASSSVSSGATIEIGGADTRADQKIGIYANSDNISLDNIDVNSTHSPVLKIWTAPLTLAGNLTINSGATVNANGQTLNIAGNLINSSSV